MADKPIAAALRRVVEFTPKTGFNVVGVDSYEEPGEELYLVGHYSTKEEAEYVAEKMVRDAKAAGNTPERMYVYGPE